MSSLVEKANESAITTSETLKEGAVDGGKEPERIVDMKEAELAKEQLKGLLGQTFRILISDGRLVEGEFQCMDKDLNFILGGAVEYYGLKDRATIEEIPINTISRKLGMAMIPGKHVVQVLHLRKEETKAKEEV